jgi:hypothetical protein
MISQQKRKSVARPPPDLPLPLCLQSGETPEIGSNLVSWGDLKPEQSGPDRRISGKTFVIILVIAVALGLILTVWAIYLNAAPSGTATLTGTLLISSTGAPATGSSGSSFTETYNVTLAAVSGSGTMNLTLLTGTSDILQQHDFAITSFLVSPNNLTMTFSGASVNLGWINNSTLWKSMNDTYIGAWGPSAPANELRGSISPADFPGVPQGYYVLLSLSITSQPTNNIPIVLNQVSSREPAVSADVLAAAKR